MLKQKEKELVRFFANIKTMWENFLSISMVCGGRHLKILRSISLALSYSSKLETFVWIWDHVSIWFYMMVPIYKLDQICNSSQSPARF